ncbi:MAG TPA: translesion DNA synthesis-associated protein ImuA [Steroidobacteraceae bacterium]|nr:translesion DNA synthesis-associated protein ImuA [Steroidobacteraceae bacterium]
MSDDPLARLLQHPALWRGRSAAQLPTWSTGFPALDASLPGGGWPRAGLVELLTPRPGVGELRLLVPVLAQLSGLTPARWLAWIAPPFEPFAPALAERGIALDRQLIVRTAAPLWAMEQALGSGACEAALAWAPRVRARGLRRLQLATERGRTLGIVFREASAAREPSPAALRLAVVPHGGGVEVSLLKSRGGARGAIHLQFGDGRAEER